jgi:hypothetical protein
MVRAGEAKKESSKFKVQSSKFKEPGGEEEKDHPGMVAGGATEKESSKWKVQG